MGEDVEGAEGGEELFVKVLVLSEDGWVSVGDDSEGGKSATYELLCRRRGGKEGKGGERRENKQTYGLRQRKTSLAAWARTGATLGVDVKTRDV
jgi:ribosomal protein L21